MAYKKQIQSPSLKKLNNILIKTLPENTGTTIIPCIEIMDGESFAIIWSNNPDGKAGEGKLQNQGV